MNSTDLASEEVSVDNICAVVSADEDSMIFSDKVLFESLMSRSRAVNVAPADRLRCNLLLFQKKNLVTVNKYK